MPKLASLCAVDVIESGRVRRMATAAPTQRAQDLLASHIPVFDAADDAVARVLASGTSEVARRTPTGPGPWHDLGVTGYLCLPLVDRSRAFGAVTLLSTAEHSFDGHTVALAEELARRAALAARNARQYTHRHTLARDLQAGLLLPDLPQVRGADVATYYHPAGEGLDIGGDFYDVFPCTTAGGRSCSATSADEAPSRPPPPPWSATPPAPSPRCCRAPRTSSTPSTGP
ncbi:GAF domain-containing protein [Streptomyces zhihengii]